MELPGLKRVHHPYRRGERRRKPFPLEQELVPGGDITFYSPGIPYAARGILLLVEPEAPLRWSLGNALVQHGYSVAEAVTAAEAAVLLARVSFDVLLVDLDLPDDTGCVLLRALAGNAALKTPLIILPTRQHSDRPVNDLSGLVQPTWLEDLLHLVERIRPGVELPGRSITEAETGVLQ